VNKFLRNTITNWRKLLLSMKDETFIVAVSGGADSIALLSTLCELKRLKKLQLEFIVAHFNHNLRGIESDDDAEYVVNMAKEFDCEIVVGEGNIIKKGNLEEVARKARYQFLGEVAEKHQAHGILTAHTINDQAETFLMNLIRGSGVEGLSAMKENRAFSDTSEIRLVRPLLNWATRSDTEIYCRERNLEFRNDSMNEDLKYSRVRVRKLLIPLLETFNPKAVQTIAKTAGLLQLKHLENEQTILPISAELKLSELISVDKIRLYVILRRWLVLHCGSLRGIGLKHIEAIERLIFSEKSGREVELPRFRSVVKKNGFLLFKKHSLKKD
jgi:tRNA(Ile)-lysidine synthase